MKDKEIRKLVQQREEMLRIIGVLVERAGGEVTILPDELRPDREVGRQRIAFTDAIVVTAHRA